MTYSQPAPQQESAMCSSFNERMKSPEPIEDIGRGLARHNPGLERLARYVRGELDPSQGIKDGLFEHVRFSLSEPFGHESRFGAAMHRIFVLLSSIDRIDQMEYFERHGFSDISVPFAEAQLPSDIRNHKSLLERFMKTQKRLCSNPMTLNPRRGHESKHAHILAWTKHFEKVKCLGARGNGEVLAVRSKYQHSTVLNAPGLGTHQRQSTDVGFNPSVQYAMKTFRRYDETGSDLEDVKVFQNELRVLRHVDHPHLVQLVGSYTASTCFGILTCPVAEQNLRVYLESVLDPDSGSSRRNNLSRFFGCLSAALDYLHHNKIRHRDIKPENILVEANNVLLCDFGYSKLWGDASSKATRGTIQGTWRYNAPEVNNPGSDHNEKTDIWALGCVFLEMWTIIQGKSITDLFKHLQAEGGGHWTYSWKKDTIPSWLTTLCEARKLGSHEPYKWISGMVRPYKSLTSTPYLSPAARTGSGSSTISH